jgi:hypothetical protein
LAVSGSAAGDSTVSTGFVERVVRLDAAGLRIEGVWEAPGDTTTFFSETRLDAICTNSPTYNFKN